VVLKKDLDVINAVAQHGQAVNAHPEGEAADFFGVVVNEAIDRGIDHARAKKLDPARALAFGTDASPGGRAAPAAENAGDIEFDRRLGERKIAGPEARLDARAEKLLHKIFDGAGELEETDVGVHGQAFDLMEHEGDRKSTRLNSSHRTISYAVFCLK